MVDKKDETEESKEGPQELKITLDQCDKSYFDRVIAGEAKPTVVYHDDEKCIAFISDTPVSKVHFIVLAKKPEQEGHLLIIASISFLIVL